MSSSYRRIEAVNKAGEIIKFIANQRITPTGQEIASAIRLPIGTTMCHLITLEDLGFIRSVSDGWELGMQLPLLWSRYKSITEGRVEKLQNELKELGV